MDDLINKVRALTSDERATAKDRAAERVAGPMPRPRDFEVETIGRFPPFVEAVSIGILIFLIIVGFVPSGMRIFSYGSELFGHTIDNLFASYVAGIATVLMAETAQVAFSLVILFVPQGEDGKFSRALFYFGMFCATMIALVFNVEVTMIRGPHLSYPSGIFLVEIANLTLGGWLEAIFPPILVLIGAHGLKNVILHKMELRFERKKNYEAALGEWHDRIKSPESDSHYRRYLFSELRDALIDANARLGRARLSDLDPKIWGMLVHREINAENEMYAAIEHYEAQAEQTEAEEPQTTADIELPFLHGSGKKNGATPGPKIHNLTN